MFHIVYEFIWNKYYEKVLGMKKEETNIDLNLDMNIGTIEGEKGKPTLEDLEITKSRGRNILDKEANDSNVSGIANFRVMGNNQ